MRAQRADDADVVIVGAGLAGLSAAVELTRAGLHVLLLEAAERPGGRIVTDLVDGFRLDRGFQLLNPAYPRLRRLASYGVLDLDQLSLRSFEAGVRVAIEGRHSVLADPRRNPRHLISTVGGPGSPVEKALFATWALTCALRRPSRLLTGRDEPYGAVLDRLKITGAVRRSVLEPFLAGVLGEDEQQSSARFVSMLIRTFVRGTPAVPDLGMQALPDQLARSLPAGALRLGVRVTGVEGGRVSTEDGGAVTARAVLVASDPSAAAGLTGLDRPAMQSLSTFWFAAEHAPYSQPLLHIDGLRRGPVVNAAVLSAAAPGYSPDHRALIGASMVGLPDVSTEQAVRHQLSLMYDTRAEDWELLRVDAIAEALPSMRPPLNVRQPVRLSDTLFVAGDHRDTASQQGALASGARAAAAVRWQLRA